MANDNSLCVAIDLGTTNSLIATCRFENGKISTPVKKVSRIINPQGVKRNDSLLPSAVYYPQTMEGGKDLPVVGDFAKEMYVSVPFRVAKSIKSQMGKPFVTGLQEGIQDTRPEEVSARIIRHLINDLEIHYDEEIKDVVITVPASFDPAQRLATLKAAEYAGVDVRNEDGSYNQDILLSEPEAVMYSILNQIKKGEYDANLDFDTEKTVLVFDIGGGTLDITLHSIKKNAENPEILDMNLIATNRFTPVAGDTFDEYTAEAMYKQYVETYRSQLYEAADRIEERKDMVLAGLKTYAESLKVAINNRYDDAFYRHKVLSDDADFECGGAMPNGYAYDGFFTKAEYEKSVQPLLGENYSYDDYKTIEGKSQTQDIIWPILDVLRKGAKKLNTDDIKIDAVIMSGGMSRLYLIKNRLEKFFGFHVISVPDPDQAVVQGAVVYHFHQHRDSELMKRLHEKEHSEFKETDNLVPRPEIITEPVPDIFIKKGNAVLGDPIFLGLKGGAVKQLADEGQELPYSSEKITGFRVEKGQNVVCVPIQKNGSHPGELVTIASGIINFSTKPKTDMPVSIRFDISRNQIITIEAWMSEDEQGLNPIEKGHVSFSFKEEKNGSSKGPKTRIVPPPGSRLISKNEITAFCDLCKRNSAAATIKLRKNTITSCSNPQDFAEPILEALEKNQQVETICFHLIPVARRMSKFWTDAEKKALVKICQSIISTELSGLSMRKNSWKSVYNECILTIGIDGSERDVERLFNPRLTNSQHYYSALIHSFSYHGMYADWVCERLIHGDAEAYRWVGLAINRSGGSGIDSQTANTVVKALIATLYKGYDNRNQMINAIISLGLACDSRKNSAALIDSDLSSEAEAEIKSLDRYYTEEFLLPCRRVIDVALKLISGEQLNNVEEEFLLSLYED